MRRNELSDPNDTTKKNVAADVRGVYKLVHSVIHLHPLGVFVQIERPACHVISGDDRGTALENGHEEKLYVERSTKDELST